jgi:putative phosphoribosyl transferase
VLRAEVDDLVYVQVPEDFIAVGRWYERFEETTDEEVVALLARADRAHRRERPESVRGRAHPRGRVRGQWRGRRGQRAGRTAPQGT